jgi:GntR family transcriptional regulator, transcriptional repressor for pyruvate dehydrogenase complex
VNLKPIRTRSVSESVYEQLRDAILTGEVRAGDVLPGERKLCEMLEVNRGAVREALKRLEQDQLVAIQQGEATRVLDFRDSARLDLLTQLMVKREGVTDSTVTMAVGELRCAITPDIARLAALRRGPAMAEQILAALAHLDGDAGRSAIFQERVEAFMTVLVQASQNVAYQLVNNTMREVHLRFAENVWERFRNSEYSNVERYRAIAEAVISGDAARAEALARARSEAILRALGAGGPLPHPAPILLPD